MALYVPHTIFPFGAAFVCQAGNFLILLHKPKHVAVKPYSIKSVVVNGSCCPCVCKLK